MKSNTYTETDDPVSVPKSPIPCQPTMRLRTCGGGGVALARRDATLNAPVDCQIFSHKRPFES